MKTKIFILFLFGICHSCCFYDSRAEQAEKEMVDSLRLEVIGKNNIDVLPQLHEYYKSIDKEWEMIAYYMILSNRGYAPADYMIYKIISTDTALHKEKWENVALKYLRHGVELNDTNCVKIWNELNSSY